MPVLISLLRGVNVGGNHRIKMDALRTSYESLGLQNPQTYVQSGNVVFQTEEQDFARLAARIENCIEQNFGFYASVVIRTLAEMRETIARNPFAQREEMHPSKLLVYFLASDPGEEARQSVRSMSKGPEELWLAGKETFVYFPDGMGRSKFPWTKIDKALKTPGTGRNWNSVTQLLQMGEKMQTGLTEQEQ